MAHETEHTTSSSRHRINTYPLGMLHYSLHGVRTEVVEHLSGLVSVCLKYTKAA